MLRIAGQPREPLKLVIPNPIVHKQRTTDADRAEKRKQKELAREAAAAARKADAKQRQEKKVVWNYSKSRRSRFAGPREEFCNHCGMHCHEFICHVTGLSIEHYPILSYRGASSCSIEGCACRGQPTPPPTCPIFQPSHATPAGLRHPVCMRCYSSGAHTAAKCPCRLQNTARDDYSYVTHGARRHLEDLWLNVLTFDEELPVCVNMPCFPPTADDWRQVREHGLNAPILYCVAEDGQRIFASVDEKFKAHKMVDNLQDTTQLLFESLRLRAQTLPTGLTMGLPMGLPMVQPRGLPMGPSTAPTEIGTEDDVLPLPVPVQPRRPKRAKFDSTLV